MKFVFVLLAYLLCELTYFITMGNTIAIVMIYYLGISFLGVIYFKVMNSIMRRFKNGKD